MYFPQNIDTTGLPDNIASEAMKSWMTKTDGQRRAIHAVAEGRKAWKRRGINALMAEARLSLEPNARLDAQAPIFFERFLERISTIIREEKFPRMIAKTFFQMTDTPPVLGQKFATTLGFREVGEAGLIETGIEEMSYVEIHGSEQSVRIVALQSAFIFSMLQQAAQALAMGNFGININVQERKSRAATRKIEHRDDYLISYGDSALGIYGALTLDTAPNSVTEFSVTNGSWDQAGTTADQIIADIEEIRNKVSTDSNECWEVTDILLPTKAYSGLFRQIGSSGKSIMQYLKETYQDEDMLNFRQWWRCDKVPGHTNRSMAFANNRDVIEYHSGPGIEMAPLHHSHPTAWTQQLMKPCGGVSTSNPKGIVYIDNLVA